MTMKVTMSIVAGAQISLSDALAKVHRINIKGLCEQCDYSVGRISGGGDSELWLGRADLIRVESVADRIERELRD